MKSCAILLAAQASKKICAVYGKSILSKSAAQKCFARIRSGNFNLKDNSRSGCPISEKADKIRENLQHARH